MDKQNVRERYIMEYYASEINQERINTVWFLLYEESSSQSRKEWCGYQGLGVGERSQCLRGTEIQFFKMKTVLWMDSGDGCTSAWMYFMPLKCTIKNGKGGKFHHSKKIFILNLTISHQLHWYHLSQDSITLCPDSCRSLPTRLCFYSCHSPVLHCPREISWEPICNLKFSSIHIKKQ